MVCRPHPDPGAFGSRLQSCEFSGIWRQGSQPALYFSWLLGALVEGSHSLHLAVVRNPGLQHRGALPVLHHSQVAGRSGNGG